MTVNEPIKIHFSIENIATEPTYYLEMKTSAWLFSLKLNTFLLYPAPKIKAAFDIMYRSQDAPKGFGICKLCLDYIKTLYDNKSKENKQIKRVYKYIDNYLALYHLYTEGG